MKQDSSRSSRRQPFFLLHIIFDLLPDLRSIRGKGSGRVSLLRRRDRPCIQAWDRDEYSIYNSIDETTLDDFHLESGRCCVDEDVEFLLEIDLVRRPLELYLLTLANLVVIRIDPQEIFLVSDFFSP